MSKPFGQSSSFDKMQQSQRTGMHATVYEIRRDPKLNNKDVIKDTKGQSFFPFVSGSSYKGQWLGDKKHGFGIQRNSNNTKYEGEWMDNKYHGRGTLWVSKGNKKGEYTRQYVGEWEQGLMHGEGTYYYKDGKVYRGEWQYNRRNGRGSMEYEGDVYMGEWKDDLRHGQGTMSYDNGNVYEGLWHEDKKEGAGLFYYPSTGKIYEAEWLDDQPRCGEFRNPTEEEKSRFYRRDAPQTYAKAYELPELTLSDAKGVVAKALAICRTDKIKQDTQLTSLHAQEAIDPTNLEEAYKVFRELSQGEEFVSIYKLGDVLEQLGLNLQPEDINQIVLQLEMKDALELSFAEAVEVALYIHQRE